MELNMNKKNKRLAEWAGFKYLGNSYRGKPLWLEPDEEYDIGEPTGYDDGFPLYRLPRKDAEMDIPDFFNDPNACFEWLVPKVRLTNEVSITIPPGRIDRYIVRIGHGRPIEENILSLALCEAILQVIDAGG